MDVTTIIAGTVVRKVQFITLYHNRSFLVLVFKLILCFVTGETGDTHIKSLRVRQIKNFHLALMISQVKTIANIL